MGREKVVLIVEDNPGDAELIGICLEDFEIPLDISFVSDGAEALDFLKQRGPHPDAARPDLVLIDLNMPKKSGHDVLAERTDDPALRSIPFIVFSSSARDDDIELAYALGANSYVSKPIDIGELRSALALVFKYWFEVVKVPAGPT